MGDTFTVTGAADGAKLVEINKAVTSITTTTVSETVNLILKGSNTTSFRIPGDHRSNITNGEFVYITIDGVTNGYVVTNRIFASSNTTVTVRGEVAESDSSPTE